MSQQPNLGCTSTCSMTSPLFFFATGDNSCYLSPTLKILGNNLLGIFQWMMVLYNIFTREEDVISCCLAKHSYVAKLEHVVNDKYTALQFKHVVRVITLVVMLL